MLSPPKTVSKSADRATYHTATGFEALIGYLYLAGRKDRLSEIFGAMALNAESLQE
jgi:ribonuclease-3 family protein